MPLFFLIAGLILIVTVVNGTTFALARQLKQDLTGGWVKWFAAVLLIGALGYVDALKTPSRYLLALVFLVIMITSGTGFISMFVQQVTNPGQAPAPQPAGGNPNLPAIPVQTQAAPAPGAQQGGQGGGSNPIGAAVSTVSSIGRLFGLSL